MADGNEGTEEGTGEAQQTEETQGTGTQTQPDEVTTLRSRNAGLDAKVTELTKAQKAALERAERAEAKALELAQAKEGGDEVLRAQLAAKEAELEKVRQEATLARIEAKYPETFGVLGEAAANLSEDKLAEAEARFKGVAEQTPPRPVGNNQQRSAASGGKPMTAKEEYEDLKARILATPLELP